MYPWPESTPDDLMDSYRMEGGENGVYDAVCLTCGESFKVCVVSDGELERSYVLMLESHYRQHTR